MKQLVWYLPLLAVAPLGAFLGPYLSGRGLWSSGTGLFLAIGCFFIVPLPVALLFSLRAKTTVERRILLFLGALGLQVLFIFGPSPSSSYQMLGLAHRLRREFPLAQVHDCANQLRHKLRAGTLSVSGSPKETLGLWFRIPLPLYRNQNCLPTCAGDSSVFACNNATARQMQTWSSP